MEKTIFILREVAWSYFDEPQLSYVGPNEIYKKFATYEEALAEKSKLELYMVKYHRVDSDYHCNPNFGNIDYFRILQNGSFNDFKDYFGIDWKEIWESNLINKSKMDIRIFSDIVNKHILSTALKDDRLISYILKLIGLNFYEISEVKETACLYKIYNNIDFKDFFILFKSSGIPFDEKEEDMGYNEYIQEFYYGSLYEVENKVYNTFYWHLADTFYDEKNYLKGSLSDLSEAPTILKSYLENYSKYFVYDTENLLLSMKNQAPNDVMRGFVALLRPEKVPFIIKSFPISEIPEKCIEVEKLKKEEREKQHLENANDLPF